MLESDEVSTSDVLGTGAAGSVFLGQEGELNEPPP
jgi:hypothetical protein